MRKTTLQTLLFCLLLLLLPATLFFSSCQKFFSDDKVYSPINSIDLSTKIISSASGFVTDENDQPVLNATVQLGDRTISTDKYGFFEVKNATVIKDAATVMVTRSGYFKAIKTYNAADGKAAFFRIKLIRKTIAGTANGTSGGVLTLANGLSISFPANAVVNASTNAAYTGTVNIATHWINPTSGDLPLEMPGDLRGLDSRNKIQLLTTYGMVAVELTGSGGEQLQIATGKKATLSLPIPSSFVSTAPNTIPLWYMDEATGLWKEQGIATKSGSSYIGEVDHFSFWNVDIPGSFVQLDATIVINTGSNSSTIQPLANARVKISVVSNPANFRYGYTDAAGYVKGFVPANAQLLFEVFGNTNCSTPIYSQNVTTTATNISLGTIEVTIANSMAFITGNIVNCSNSPVTNGYVMLLSGNMYTRYNLSNTGTYSGTLVLCNNNAATVILYAEDLTTNQTGNPVTRNIVPGNNTVPAIQVCGNISQEYVHLIKNGVAQNYNVPPCRLLLTQGTSTSYGVIIYLDPAMTIPGGGFQFINTGIAAGSTQTLVTMWLAGASQNLLITNPPVNVSITEFGAVGQYIAGNYSGNFVQPPGMQPYAISCNFRIKRTF